MTVFTGQRSFQSSNEIAAEVASETSQASGFSKLVGKSVHIVFSLAHKPNFHIGLSTIYFIPWLLSLPKFAVCINLTNLLFYNQTAKTSVGASHAFFLFLGICYSWITSHILGLIQLAIPLGVVYSRFTCQTLIDMRDNSELFFCYAVITAIVHSINFNLLNSWMKSTIGMCTY